MNENAGNGVSNAKMMYFYQFFDRDTVKCVTDWIFF